MEEVFESSNEIEKFWIEHVFIGIEDGGAIKEVATVKEVDQQDQRQLEDAIFFNGDEDKDKGQETYQALEKDRAKEEFQSRKDQMEA